jgi:hypothetical protein
MSSRTPAGFYFVSVCAAAFGVCMTLVAGMMEDLGGPLAMILIRAVAGLLACLSGVAAAALTLLSLWACGLDGLMATVGILLFTGCVLLPIVMYVRDRTAWLFGPQRQQPRPAPARPAAPGRRPQPRW